jgi:hypothetical protein
VLACVGCNPRAKDEAGEKQAVARLCWAENRIRTAPNADKFGFLADLTRSPCPTPSACNMRDRCAEGYGTHVEALRLTAAAKQLLTDGRDGDAAGILGAAEAKLKEAGPRITECTSLAADLRRQYSLDR